MTGRTGPQQHLRVGPPPTRPDGTRHRPGPLRRRSRPATSSTAPPRHLMTVQGWGRYYHSCLADAHAGLDRQVPLQPRRHNGRASPQARATRARSARSRASSWSSKQLPTLKRSRTLKLVRRSAIRPPHRRAATVSSDVPEHGKWLVTKGSTTTSWPIDGKRGLPLVSGQRADRRHHCDVVVEQGAVSSPPRGGRSAGIAAVAISDHMQAI